MISVRIRNRQNRWVELTGPFPFETGYSIFATHIMTRENVEFFYILTIHLGQ